MPRIIFRVAFTTLLAAVTVGSFLPGGAPPAGGLSDKVIHAAAYLALGLAGLASFPASAGRVCAGLLLWGAGIELAQTFVPTRSGEFADFVANSVGVCTAWGLFRLSGRFRSSPDFPAPDPE